jgi:hypothetical protein
VTTACYRDYSQLADYLFMPEGTDLMLLANPKNVGIVSPNVQWTRKKSTLSWQVEAGQTYIVRYRYHPSFVATQGSMQLSVEPHPVIDGISLRFMSIKAEKEGALDLTFRSRWI